MLDVRSAQEYAIAHIPGSINHYEKEVEQITKAYPDHRPLWCSTAMAPTAENQNGCPKS